VTVIFIGGFMHEASRQGKHILEILVGYHQGW